MQDEEDTAPSRVGGSQGGRLGCILLTVCLVGGGVFGIRQLMSSRQPAQERRGQGRGQGNRPVPVTVARVARREVPVEVTVVGSVTPYSSVPVTAQIGGQLQRVFFQQGDFVTQGQPLFAIDPRPQQAVVAQNAAVVQRDQAAVAQSQANLARDRNLVDQARGTVARDRAAVEQARAQLRRDQAQMHFYQDEAIRYRNLLKLGYVTIEQAQQQATNVTTYQATLAADQAAVDSAQATLASSQAALRGQQSVLAADHANIQSAQAAVQADVAGGLGAKLQLEYTYIRSPITGRTGTLNIHEGTLVRANDTAPLITIYQIQPIFVSFAVPEKYLPEIQKYERAGNLTVTARLADVEGPPEIGKMTFIENTVDATTGTITLRATFPNPRRRLWPGQFVNVTLLLRRQPNALVVPSQAVQPGQNGDSIFVMKEDKTVESRPVQVDFLYQDYSVLKSGVKEGETVITDGQLQLTSGANVTVVKPGSSPTPQASETPGEHGHRGRRP